jgi:hypothetical protein
MRHGGNLEQQLGGRAVIHAPAQRVLIDALGVAGPMPAVGKAAHRLTAAIERSSRRTSWPPQPVMMPPVARPMAVMSSLTA